MKKKTRIFIVLLTFVLAFQSPLALSTTYAASAKTTAKAKAKAKSAKKMKKLEKKLNKYIKKSCPGGPNGESKAAAWSVYVKDLDNNTSFIINKSAFCSCSTIKLFAMATAYDQAQKGKLEMTPALESQIRSMITVSSNEAFNDLVYNKMRKGAINNFCKAGGYGRTAQYTPCSAGNSAAMVGENRFNITSAYNCGKLLEQIYRKKLVSKSASKKMLKYLKAQTVRTKIPRGVPVGITVANKTGEAVNMENDVAIVYGKKTTYIVCVFSTTSNAAQARNCIAEISRMVYSALN